MAAASRLTGPYAMAAGDVAPLAEIVALKERHCFRLVVDESMAFASLPGGLVRSRARTPPEPTREGRAFLAFLGQPPGSRRVPRPRMQSGYRADTERP